ncbi:hypothetical protein, partial [Mesotoga sp.]|uniref:hypothetical protein n=1 Tax=Mesotoga sp. TaxID=2053577 RepID=UPI00345E12B0
LFGHPVMLLHGIWSRKQGKVRDPDQEHCQDDVKGVILTSRRVCPDELLFCHPVVFLYGISPKEPLNV